VSRRVPWISLNRTKSKKRLRPCHRSRWNQWRNQLTALPRRLAGFAWKSCRMKEREGEKEQGKGERPLK